MSLLEAAEPQAAGSSNNERYRIVVDTSVLISAIFFGGKAEAALRHILASHTMVLSDFIVDEVIAFARATDPKTPVKILRLIRTKLEKYCRDYEPDVSIEVRDINDTDIVALAQERQAIILTSDQDLLAYKADATTPILSIAEYTELFLHS
jgi:predicted nucleic acid-binding protein